MVLAVDHIGPNHLRATTEHLSPPSPEPARPRVVRGGSWNDQPENARSAYRNRNTTDNRNNNLGFRVARSVVLPSTL